MLDHICCFIKYSAVSNHLANQWACRDPKKFRSCIFWEDLFPTTEVFASEEELGNLIDRKEEREGKSSQEVVEVGSASHWKKDMVNAKLKN